MFTDVSNDIILMPQFLEVGRNIL